MSVSSKNSKKTASVFQLDDSFADGLLTDHASVECEQFSISKPKNRDSHTTNSSLTTRTLAALVLTVASVSTVNAQDIVTVKTSPADASGYTIAPYTVQTAAGVVKISTLPDQMKPYQTKSDLTSKTNLGLFSVVGSRDCTKGATKEDVFARCATNRTGIREATALRYRADGVLELTTQDGLGLANNTASSTRSQIATRPEGTLVH